MEESELPDCERVVVFGAFLLREKTLYGEGVREKIWTVRFVALTLVINLCKFGTSTRLCKEVCNPQ